MLICHERPDGDSVGSLLALGVALQSLGKRVTLVSSDPVPDVFKFLDGWQSIQNDFLSGDYKAVVLVDNGDCRRTGFGERIIALKKRSIPLVNIDHHTKNDLWRIANINYVDTEASSTCELIYQIIIGLDIAITPTIATALMTGIYTDTGGFRHSNTSKGVLEVSSELLKKGAKLRTISSNVSNSHSVSMLKLWGIALSRLSMNHDFGLAYSVLTRGDIEQVGANDEEVSGLVNLINAIPECRAALLLYETADGKIKGSLRTESESLDLSKLANLLCGGGHKKACGFSFSGHLEQAEDVWQAI